MAEATLVQAATSAFSSSGPSASFGATPTEGNLLIALGTGRSGETSLSMSSSGWTKVFDHPANSADSTYRRILTVWRKIAGSSESTSVSLSNTGNLLGISALEFSIDTAYDTWTFEDHSVDDDGATTNGDNVSSGSTASISNTPMLLVGAGMAKLNGGGNVTNDGMTNLLNEDEDNGGGSFGLCNAWGYDQDATTGTKESQVDWGTSSRTGTIMAILAFSMSSSAGATEVALAGSLPAFSGGLASQQYEDLTGNLPAPSATIEPDYEKRHLAGVLPAPSATIASQLDAARNVTGSLPAQNGALAVSENPTLLGDLPAQSATLAAVQSLFRAVGGNLPAMTGAIEALYGKRNLAGVLPAPTGAIASQLDAARALTGSLPAQSGVLSLLAHIGLAGTLPPQAGALVALYKAVHLAGDLPAMAGALAVSEETALGGTLPAPVGALGVRVRVSDGPSSPATAANDGGGTATWANVNNVFAQDTSYATTSIAADGDSEHLLATGFGFAIPTNAPIAGVVAEARIRSDGGNYYGRMQLAKAGTRTGNTLIAEDVTSTFSYISRGGASNLWGATLTAAEVNASGFGVAIRVQDLFTGAAADFELDHIRLTVYYFALPPASLLGDLPAASGDLAASGITIGGSLPAQSGLLALFAQIGLAGVLPAQSSALAVLYRIALAGSVPAMDGTLTETKLPLAGNLPPMDGDVSSVGNLTGELPPMDGGLLPSAISIDGSLPAMNGALAANFLFQQIALAGSLPAMAGAVSAFEAARTLAGEIPAMAGDLEFDLVLQHAALAGTLGDFAGTLAFLELQVRLNGVLPAMAGDIAYRYLTRRAPEYLNPGSSVFRPAAQRGASRYNSPQRGASRFRRPGPGSSS